LDQKHFLGLPENLLRYWLSWLYSATLKLFYKKKCTKNGNKIKYKKWITKECAHKALIIPNLDVLTLRLGIQFPNHFQTKDIKISKFGP
jgi:hypothetical protein